MSSWWHSMASPRAASNWRGEAEHAKSGARRESAAKSRVEEPRWSEGRSGREARLKIYKTTNCYHSWSLRFSVVNSAASDEAVTSICHRLRAMSRRTPGLDCEAPQGAERRRRDSCRETVD